MGKLPSSPPGPWSAPRVALPFLCIGAVGLAVFLWQRQGLVAAGSGRSERSADGAPGSPESTGASVGGGPFVAAPEGRWDAYFVEHASEGVADATGGTTVETRYQADAYLLHMKGATLLVPARVFARVVARNAETLFARGELAAADAGGVRTRTAPSIFDSSLVRLALAGDGLLYFPAASEPGLSFEGVKHLRREADGAAPSAGPLLTNLIVDASRVFAFRSPVTLEGGIEGGRSFRYDEFDEEAPAETTYRVLGLAGDVATLQRTVRTRGSARSADGSSAGLSTAVEDARELGVEPAPFSLVTGSGTRTQTLSRGSTPLARNVFRWNVRRTASGRLGDAQLLEVDLLLREALGAHAPPGRTPNLVRQMHKETLGDDTLASLLARLDGLARPGTQATEGEKTRLYLKLKALLVLQPDLASAVGERARGAAPGSLELQLLAGALSSAGTLEAQAALVSLLEASPQGGRKRLEVVPLLGMAENPSASTLLFLEGLSRAPAGPESTAALLALGIAAHKARGNEGALAKRMASSIRERLLSATSNEEIVRLLASGGNTEDPDFLAAATGFLSHRSEAVRAQAIFALRMAPFDRFYDHYRLALRDPSEKVRERTLDALGQQPKSQRLGALLMEAFAEQKSTRLKVGLLRKIWSNGVEGRGPDAQARPEVMEFVEGVAQDPSLPDVSQLAMELLGSKGP